MQQRQLRLGDILDDYCPRERRITNHAVVAMIADEVRQTRCTTCDSEHEYKQARIPPQRKRRDPAAPAASSAPAAAPRRAARVLTPAPDTPAEPAPIETRDDGDVAMAEPPASEPAPVAAASERDEGEGPVHRQLIRATLPRPEGQPQARPLPEFTIRQSPGPSKGWTPGNGRSGWKRANPYGGRGQGGGAGSGRHASGRSGGAAGRRTSDRQSHQTFSSHRSHAAPIARSGKKRSK